MNNSVGKVVSIDMDKKGQFLIPCSEYPYVLPGKIIRVKPSQIENLYDVYCHTEDRIILNVPEWKLSSY